MSYKANCTYCISQMFNTYPNRRKNPMLKDKLQIYIAVDTKEEADYIESINKHMQTAYLQLNNLEHFIENK